MLAARINSFSIEGEIFRTKKRKEKKREKKTKKRSEKWCANKRETTKGLPRRVIIVDGLGGGVGWKTKKKEKKGRGVWMFWYFR